MELGDLDGATLAYQRVSRDSQVFGVALYEMAWTYIKSEQYDMALATVDTLLLTAREPELEMQGYTLRGRLNIFLNDYDSAGGASSIVNRFAAKKRTYDVHG